MIAELIAQWDNISHRGCILHFSPCAIFVHVLLLLRRASSVRRPVQDGSSCRVVAVAALGLCGGVVPSGVAYSPLLVELVGEVLESLRLEIRQNLLIGEIRAPGRVSIRPRGLALSHGEVLVGVS